MLSSTGDALGRLRLWSRNHSVRIAMEYIARAEVNVCWLTEDHVPGVLQCSPREIVRVPTGKKVTANGRIEISRMSENSFAFDDKRCTAVRLDAGFWRRAELLL